MVLATEEKALLAFEPTRRMVPTTKTKITASITAYSAMSWPPSSVQSWGRDTHLPAIPFNRENSEIHHQDLKTRSASPLPASYSVAILATDRSDIQILGFDSRSAIGRGIVLGP